MRTAKRSSLNWEATWGWITPFLLTRWITYWAASCPTDWKHMLAQDATDAALVRAWSRGCGNAFLDEVCRPYAAWKTAEGLLDWNDLAVSMAHETLESYDIVIVDEAQDFSANQLRAVANQLAPTHSMNFILDAVQRIYPRGFSTWRETGLDVPPRNVFSLLENFRNTREIARIARCLVEGLEPSDDGSLPDLELVRHKGPCQLSRQAHSVVRWTSSSSRSLRTSQPAIRSRSCIRKVAGTSRTRSVVSIALESTGSN